MIVLVMPRAGCTIATLAGLMLACTPKQARSAPPEAAAAEPAPTGEREAATTPSTPTPPQKAFACRVQVEIREADRAEGTGMSAQSPAEAHDLAWRRACEDLHTRTGLDCTDDTRVRVVKRSSSTRMTLDGEGKHAQYEQTFELVGFRLADGEGQSDESWAAACAAAATRACEAATGRACPDDRVTVLKTDGQGAPTPPPGPPARRTI